jgi:hypothetical protein
MTDPWESLSVNQRRGLLAGVFTADLFGPMYFDVYDVSKDCTKPELKASLPVNTAGHEGDWAPDGMTYYGAGAVITAIDVTDPSLPRPVGRITSATTHGLSISEDGNRAYLAGQPIGEQGNGMTIVDTSQIQARNPAPVTPVVGTVTWEDGSTAQHTIPLTIKGRPHVLFVDEGPTSMGAGQGAARIIDITDETKPRVISKLKLEIHMPVNGEKAQESASSGFGYNAHYCNVDRQIDPTIVVCSMFNSGMRVFDVRDPSRVREIAYYNPGGTGELSPQGSQWAFPNQQQGAIVDAGYPAAKPRILADRGEIWFTDQNRGFFVVRITNGVWPFKENGAGEAPLGLPATKRCLQRSGVSFRIARARAARKAVLYVNGRRVKTVRGKALRKRLRVKLRAGRHSVVRVVVTTRKGKKVTQTRSYTRCARGS